MELQDETSQPVGFHPSPERDGADVECRRGLASIAVEALQGPFDDSRRIGVQRGHASGEQELRARPQRSIVKGAPSP